jgi:hypothetical protein
MKPLLIALLGMWLLAIYLVAWTVSYVLIFLSRGDGLDVSYYGEYFVAAWTGRAFELPGFIWLFSIAIFAPFAVLAIALIRRYAR